MVETLHAKIFLDRKLYCNGVIPLTPEKSEVSSVDLESVGACSLTAAANSSSLQALSPLSSELMSKASNSAEVTSLVNPVHSLGQPSIVLNSETLDPFIVSDAEADQMVRRHSLSLRTPHKGSLAEEIINSSRRASLETRRSILNDLKGLSEQLSDFASGSENPFASCNESPLVNSSSDDEINVSGKNEVKVDILTKKSRKKNKKKRRASKTPPKEFFLQKKSKEDKSQE